MNEKDATWFIGLTVDMTEAALQDLMVAVADWRERGATAYCFLHGFDDDPRDLVDIPEARRFCDLLLESGFAGVLTPSSDPALCMASRRDFPEETPCRPFGAFEVWTTAKGLGGTPEGPIEVDLEPFRRDMRRSLDAFYRHLAEARRSRP
jgi:hypothetical protein